MPELPEIEALATFLRERAVGRTVERVDVAAINAVKTFDPPLSALNGAWITGAGRHGKFLDLELAGEAGLLHLVVHLSRAGWLHWRESLPPAPPRPGGKGPISVRLRLAPEFDEGPVAGFDLTEAGTQKRLAVYLVRDPLEVPGVAALGPDALTISRDELARVLGSERAQLKKALDAPVRARRGRQRLLRRDPARGAAVAVQEHGQARRRRRADPAARRDGHDPRRRRRARPSGRRRRP